MKASILERERSTLQIVERELPAIEPLQVRIKVEACALCRTDLHVLDGELPQPKYPLILGHEIVGLVDSVGSSVDNLRVGDRIGVPWLASACLKCVFCLSGQENLCDNALFTGYTVDGGFAEYTVADSRFCFHMPPQYDAVHAAPLLCAGLIGWRSLRCTGSAERIGIYGFGAAAHVIAPLAIAQGRQIFAFTSAGDLSRQEFARKLGATWAGGSDQSPPEPLDAAIIFAPVGALVPKALAGVRKGGIVVCAGIHMSDIPSFPYSLLWGERTIQSVANLTRADGEEFFKLAANIALQTHVVEYPLTAINEAIRDSRNGSIQGAAVIVPPRS